LVSVLFRSGTSDQELQRMPTREQLRTTLLNLLEEEMGESYPLLTDDQDLRASLNLDSVDVVGLVMRIEREFRVRLATEDLAAVKRVGDLLDVMEAKLMAQADGPRKDPSGRQPGLT
jgi:acyl carrier protein